MNRYCIYNTLFDFLSQNSWLFVYLYLYIFSDYKVFKVYYTDLFILGLSIISTTIASVIIWCFTKRLVKRKIDAAIRDILKIISNDLSAHISRNTDSDGYERVDEIDQERQDTNVLSNKTIKGWSPQNHVSRSMSASKSASNIELTESYQHGKQSNYHRSTPNASPKARKNKPATLSRSHSEYQGKSIRPTNTSAGRMKRSKRKSAQGYHSLVLNWKKKACSYDTIIKT